MGASNSPNKDSTKNVEEENNNGNQSSEKSESKKEHNLSQNSKKEIESNESNDESEDRESNKDDESDENFEISENYENIELKKTKTINQEECKCSSVKKIIKINANNGNIEIICPKHKSKIINIIEYFQNEIIYWYENEEIIYDDKDSDEVNKPRNSDLQELRNKKDSLKKRIQNEEHVIKLLDILINTYEKNPSNNFNNNNIINISKSIKEELNIEKLLSKIESLEKKILKYLNFKLKIKISKDDLEINLNGKNIDNSTLYLLSGVEFKKCENIDLSDNKITNISAFDFNMPNLENIDFSNNKIKDISPLKKILKFNKNLEKISFANNSINKIDVNEINDNVFRYIKEINLDGNKNIQKEFDEIKKILKFNKELRKGTGCIIKYISNSSNIRLFGRRFVENNKDICKIIINEKEQDLCEFYEFEENSEAKFLYVKLKFNENPKNISHMFRECSSLISISDISNWDTSQVTDMSYLFEKCISLEYLPDISEWDISNVTDIKCMFKKCYNLKSLPDIGKWNTTNVTNMNYLFYFCNSLKTLPYIGNWNTGNVINMLYMFSQCSSLLYLPDLSKWNISHVTNLSNLFEGCSELSFLCDISNWNTSNVREMDGMFNGCKLLESIPDISNWNLENVEDISKMFYDCLSLKSLPDLSKWNISEEVNTQKMFSGCPINIIPEEFK